MAVKVLDAVLGVCSECQSVQPISRRTDLLYAEQDSPSGPFGRGEAGHYGVDSHNFAGTTVSCGGTGTTPETLLATEDIVGKAQCGCVYHAEDGTPCQHDIALAMKTAAG